MDQRVVPFDAQRALNLFGVFIVKRFLTLLLHLNQLARFGDIFSRHIAAGSCYKVRENPLHFGTLRRLRWALGVGRFRGRPFG
ncbi:hypothetical protein DPMN_119446 [Dreissena polymorpha]|uniref:Uncharacterized protein n=1 Tax=Dreissena polymorpha TaxID=45954 RepID=A0A9D4GMH5_DREPO|nr:hypothetical protein DPMN_119446 [Dreissena polymorpha]